VLSRGLDHAPQILDLDAHPPLTREPDVGVRNELEVLSDARVRDPAEVVVEELLRRGPVLLGLIIEWSSSRFSLRSTAHTCQPFASLTMVFASGSK